MDNITPVIKALLFITALVVLLLAAAVFITGMAYAGIGNYLAAMTHAIYAYLLYKLSEGALQVSQEAR